MAQRWLQVSAIAEMCAFVRPAPAVAAPPLWGGAHTPVPGAVGVDVSPTLV